MRGRPVRRLCGSLGQGLPMWVWVWVWVSVWICVLGYGCRVEAATVAPYSGEQCEGIFDFAVNTSVGQRAALESSIAQYMGIMPVWTAYDCAHELRVAVCLQSYAPVNAEKPVRTQACEDVCDSARKQCDAFLDGLEQSEPFAYTIAIGPLEACAAGNNASQCIDKSELHYTDDFALDANKVECPSPLVVPDRDDPDLPIDGTACALPCPTAFYTASEMDTLYSLYKVFTCISLVCSVYVTVLFILRRRNEPDRFKKASFTNIIRACVGIVLITVTMMLSVFPGPRKVLCRGNATLERHGTRCQVQAYLLDPPSLFAAAYVFIMVTELLVLTTRLRTKRWVLKMRKYYLPFSLVYPVFVIILMAATDIVGASPSPIPFCHIRTNSKPKWLQYLVVYAPHGLTAVYTFVALSVVIVTAGQAVTRNLGNVTTAASRASTSQGGRRGSAKTSVVAEPGGTLLGAAQPADGTRQTQDACLPDCLLGPYEKLAHYIDVTLHVLDFNRKFVLMCCVFSFIEGYFVSYRLYGEDDANETEWEHSLKTWAECLLTEGALNAKDGAKACGYRPGDRPALAATAMEVVSLSMIGTCFFLVFGARDAYNSLRAGVRRLKSAYTASGAGGLTSPPASGALVPKTKNLSSVAAPTPARDDAHVAALQLQATDDNDGGEGDGEVLDEVRHQSGAHGADTGDGVEVTALGAGPDLNAAAKAEEEDAETTATPTTMAPRRLSTAPLFNAAVGEPDSLTPV